MIYQAEYSRETQKRLDRMDRATALRMKKRLEELKASPYDLRISKPLQGGAGMRASRVGGWRILYAVNDAAKTLYVVAIRPRGEAYRDL